MQPHPPHLRPVPAGSTAEFRARHFWGAITVRGTLGPMAGEAAVLTAELHVDRAEFGMTWSPLLMASMTALGTVTARFTQRSQSSPGPPTQSRSVTGSDCGSNSL